MGKTKQPIMTLEEERFMAFEGLLQWTQAVVTQSVRVTAARDQQSVDLRSRDPLIRQQAIRNFHSECHFFVIAAYKLIEYHEWASTFGLCATLNFNEIDAFSADDIKDLRNMQEHLVEYFQGHGHSTDRQMVC